MLKRVLPYLCLFLLAHVAIAQVAPDAEIKRILAQAGAKFASARWPSARDCSTLH